jgi:hypothetical protein
MNGSAIAVNIREGIQARRGFKWMQDAWVCVWIDSSRRRRTGKRGGSESRKIRRGKGQFQIQYAVDVRVLKGNRPKQPCIGNRDVWGEHKNFGYSGREERGRSKDAKTQCDYHAYTQIHMYEI